MNVWFIVSYPALFGESMILHAFFSFEMENLFAIVLVLRQPLLFICLLPFRTIVLSISIKWYLILEEYSSISFLIY